MINIDDIITAAQQQAKLTDSLDQSTLEGLGQYIDSLNNDAPLTERGWQSIQGMLIRMLVNRLRVEDYLKQHPELLDAPIEKPLFVFGLPRTGTTLTFNLLHADPARRSPLHWEVTNSVPPPKAAELSTDPRCLEDQKLIDLAYQHAPQLSVMHHEDADSPTECQFIMTQTFCAQYFEVTTQVNSYRDWFFTADYLPAMRYHKRLLQLLQAEAPGRWTLKNPWHPLFLNELITVYPDAQLVMTHRDPVDVVGSFCNLVKNVRMMMSDDVDLHHIGRVIMDTFDCMIERMYAYREKHGWDSIYDLQYDALMKDPVGEIKKLYHHFDEPWSNQAESAMTQLMQQNPKDKRGKHNYSRDELRDYGLSNALVRERFDDYCKRLNIPTKD